MIIESSNSVEMIARNETILMSNINEDNVRLSAEDLLCEDFENSSQEESHLQTTSPHDLSDITLPDEDELVEENQVVASKESENCNVDVIMKTQQFATGIQAFEYHEYEENMHKHKKQKLLFVDNKVVPPNVTVINKIDPGLQEGKSSKFRGISKVKPQDNVLVVSDAETLDLCQSKSGFNQNCLPRSALNGDNSRKFLFAPLETMSAEDIEQELGLNDCGSSEELDSGYFSPRDRPTSSCEDLSSPANSTCGNVCTMCGLAIQEEYLLKLNGESYHETCIRCTLCDKTFGESDKCFLRDGFVFCREDYINQFGTKCARCEISLSAEDWVRQTGGFHFHLDCFACAACNVQLATGDDYGFYENRLYCKAHFLEKSRSHDSSPEAENENRGKKRRRARTTFADEQIIVLQGLFDINPNPQGTALSEIAEKVGLSRRVTQIWFQNNRAKLRQQKIQHLS